MPYDPTRVGRIGINRITPFTATEVGDLTAGGAANLQQFVDARRKFRGNVASVAARDVVPDKRPGDWVVIEVADAAAPRIDMWTGDTWVPLTGGTPRPPMPTIRTVTTSPYAATVEDHVIACRPAVPGAFIVSLPSTPPVGAQIKVKDAIGTADVHAIIVQATGSKLIDGAASSVLDAAYASRTFIFGDNNEWLVI